MTRKIMAMILSLALVISGITYSAPDVKADSDSTAVRYEAEEADSYTQGSASESYSIAESDTYSNGQAVGNLNTWPEDGRAYLTKTVTVDTAGIYEITVAYAGGEEDHPCTIDVRVNSESDDDWVSMTAEPTDDWTTVACVSTYITLEAGENTIDVTGACNVWYDGMSWEWVNVDYFELQKVGDTVITKTASDMVNDGEIRMTGRTLEEDTAMTMDYSTSGFQFVYTGSGSITANFTADSASGIVIDINGETSTETIPSGTNDVIIASDLSDGTYTVKVYKITEANGYLTQLNSISYYNEDAVFAATEESEIKFEFVGDSITCGNQIDSNTGDENGYYAWGSVLARAYDADWNTISCSGRGLMEGYNSEEDWAASQDNQLQDIYDYVSWFRDSSTAYDYSSYTPDVIILNVGSNDLGSDIMETFGTTADDFCDAVTDMANKLRSYYPDAYIIFCYGTYENRDYSDEYEAAVEALNDDSIGFVYFPQMTGGMSSHANYTQQERMAKILSELVSEKLGVDNPMDVDRHFEAEDGTIVGDGQVTTITDWVSVYSGQAYVENMSAEVSDVNDASYVSIPVSVDKAGTYEVTVSYGSTTEPVIGVRANDGDWTTYTGGYGTDWNAIQTIDATVVLEEGDNTIDVTGAINDGWASIDCIDLTYISEDTEIDDSEDETTTEASTTGSEEETETSEETTTAEGTVRYEAEDADLFYQGSSSDEASISESDNYSNGQAVGNMNTWPEDGRAYCETVVTVEEAGTYQMTIGYAGGADDGNPCSIDVRVNSGSWVSVTAPVTGSWDTVETVTLTIQLSEGENTIDVTGACQIWVEDGQDWQWINLDYFDLLRVGDAEETTEADSSDTTVRYEAENADSFTQGSASEAASISEGDCYSNGQAVANMNTWPEDGRAYCTTTVTVEKSGTYLMTIAYGGGADDGNPCTIDVRINSGSWVSTVAPVTGSWDIVSTVSLTVQLSAGDNVIDVTGACQKWVEDGEDWQWINLDYFELTRTGDAVTTTASSSNGSGTSGTTASSSTSSGSSKVTLGKAKVKKATKKKSLKKLKVTLKKVANATKYKVQVSKKKKFTKKNILVRKTVKKVKAVISSKKLKNKKKLFVRARAVAVVNGKTYKGKWSKVKKVKIS